MGRRHGKSKVDLAAMSNDVLTNWLADQIDGYERCKIAKVKSVASSYLREIEAIEAVLRERGITVSRSKVRDTGTQRKTPRPAVRIQAPSSKAHPPRTQIMYIECKMDGNDRGGARIRRVTLSKTGRTLYYGGLILQSLKGRVANANYYNVTTGLKYWCSRPKKNGQDRHWAGSGAVAIDAEVVDEYWREIRGCEPPENPYVA